MRVRYGLEDENQHWVEKGVDCADPVLYASPVPSVIAWGLAPAGCIFQTLLSAELWLVQPMGGTTGRLEKKKGISQGTTSSSLPLCWISGRGCFLHSLAMVHTKFCVCDFVCVLSLWNVSLNCYICCICQEKNWKTPLMMQSIKGGFL